MRRQLALSTMIVVSQRFGNEDKAHSIRGGVRNKFIINLKSYANINPNPYHKTNPNAISNPYTNTMSLY